ncbi:hypothetical protein NDU88_004252 [Pleurodeles waltl]|uniref:Uncharacterized protein n=1 Tax=Pleurodeles waltl TaxID=8319 RepID=A0AAV7V1B0_PLEWA|nr:hypothetical protein NDU88_004252 [Pleurodeles waltl]
MLYDASPAHYPSRQPRWAATSLKAAPRGQRSAERGRCEPKVKRLEQTQLFQEYVLLEDVVLVLCSLLERD